MRSLAIASLVCAGCIDKTVLEPTANKLDGIYQNAVFTRNLTACSPGPVIPFSHTHVLAVLDPSSRELARDSVGGRFFVLSCASQAQCRERHAQLELANGCCLGQPQLEFFFRGGELGDDTPDTIVEATFDPPMFDGVNCRVRRLDTLIARTGARLHVEKKTSVEGVFAAESGGCDFETTKEVARDLPCEQLDTLDAEIVEELDDR